MYSSVVTMSLSVVAVKDLNVCFILNFIAPNS